MKISTTGTNFIKNHESLKLAVYADCSGYPTVGYGHLLTKNIVYSQYKNKELPKDIANKELKKAGLSYTSPITKSQADSLLKKDLASSVAKVNTANCYSKLTQNQFDALVSLTFNVYSAIDSNDLKALLKNPQTFSDYKGNIDKSMNQKVTDAFTFTKSGGVRVQGLVNRRNDEMKLFCTGMRYSYNKIK